MPSTVHGCLLYCFVRKRELVQVLSCCCVGVGRRALCQVNSCHVSVLVPCRKESLRLLRKLCMFCPDAVLQEVCSRVSAAEQQQSAPFATQLTEVVLSSLSTEVHPVCLCVCLSVCTCL